MDGSEPSAAAQLARKSSYVLVQNVVTSVVTVVSFSILARLITPLEMGGMAVLLMIIGASRVVACLGMPSSVTRFMAESMARNDRARAAGIFYQAIRTNLILSSLVGIAMFLSAGHLSSWLLGTSEREILFQILAFDIVVAAGLLPTLNSAMLGLQKIREMSAINIVYTVIRQALIVTFVFATRSLLGLVIAWVISELVVALTFFRYVRSSVGSSTLAFDFKHLVRFSFPLFLQDAANYGYTWFDQVALLSYLSLESLGIYTVATAAFGALNAVAASAATVLFPTYSMIQGSDKRKALGDCIKGATRYLCLIVTPLSLGLFSTAKPCLTLLFGEAYIEGTGPLMIMSLFYAFALTLNVLACLPVVLGEPTLSLELTTLNIAVGLAFTVILLPSFGVIGTSVARGVAMTTHLAALIITLRRRICFSFDVEAFWKSLISGGAMAVILLLIQSWSYSKYLLPIYIAIGAITYVLSLLVLRTIKVQDFQLLEGYLGPRFRFITRILIRFVRVR
jgi:O-antigen/teichoic acid export membrane protein